MHSSKSASDNRVDRQLEQQRTLQQQQLAQIQQQQQQQALTAAAPGQAAGATGAGVGMVAGQQPLAARSAGAPGSAGLLVNSQTPPTMGPVSDAALAAACRVMAPKSAFKKLAPTRSQEASAPAATSTGAAPAPALAPAAAAAPVLAPQPVSVVGPRAVLLPQQPVSVVGTASGSETGISQPFLVGSPKLNAELSALRSVRTVSAGVAHVHTS